MSILQDFIAQFSALRYQNPLAQKILATRALLSQHFALDSADMSKFDKLLSELNAPLKVAVIGQFSSGKSTFLNALLGEEILPSGIIPLTSKVCEIGYGENLHLEIFYKDGTHSFAPLDFLERADPLINAQISHYKLFAPLPLLQEITFLDTPGFNSQNQEDTEVSNAILQEVDGIIWVSLIDNVGKNSEREILYNHIRHYRAKSLCVLNQKDRLKNAAEIETSLNYAREAFSGIFEEIIAISAKNALSAKTQSNSQRAQQFYEDSAIVEVFEFLHTHLMPQKAQNKEHRTLYALRALVLKYYRRLHIPQIYLRRLEGILEGYGALDSMQAQALNAQSQQLFSLLESRLLTLTQQIFSEITRVTMTFSKSAKNALGLKTTQMYEKEVYVLPLDSVLNALQRQDSPLIAYRTVHAVLFQRFNVFIAAVEVVSVAAFISKGKNRYTRIVARPHVHVHHPVPVGAVPFRSISECFLKAVSHSMRFHIGLRIHIEPKAVAQFIKEARQRIVTGPDSIDIALAHQGKIAEQFFSGNIMSGIRIVLMHVHSLELHRFSVDQQHLPLASGDFVAFRPVLYRKLPEPDIESGILTVHAHNKPVKVRVFR